jgi:hypothetical protein
VRLKSAIWVAAWIRRCQVAGAFAVLRRRGQEDAGAIFLKVDRLDGTSDLYGPAAQSLLDPAAADRAFQLYLEAVASADVEARLAREIRFDPDIWIAEIEDRAGRSFLLPEELR